VKTIDQGSTRCRGLLEQRGFSFWPEERLEEVLEVKQTRPDFFVKTALGTKFLVEVNAFEKELNGPSLGLAQIDFKQGHKRVRNAILEAAKQLRPYAEDSLPLVILMDNWNMVWLEGSVGTLLDAVFGEVVHLVPVPESDASRHPQIRCTRRDGVLNARHKTYISAVAWNLPQAHLENESTNVLFPMRVRLVHNPYAVVPLSRQVFVHTQDEQFGLDLHGRLIDL